jgi:hypothetical protein
VERVLHREGDGVGDRAESAVEFLAPFAVGPIDVVVEAHSPRAFVVIEERGVAGALPAEEGAVEGFGVGPPEFGVGVGPTDGRAIVGIDGEEEAAVGAVPAEVEVAEEMAEEGVGRCGLGTTCLR